MRKLRDFSPRRRNYNQADDAKMLSMDYYLDTAKRCISKFGGNKATNMLQDEDAISYVAEKIMWGTVNYTSDRKASLSTYHLYCARCAIKCWQRGNIETSLNHENDSNHDNQFYQRIGFLDKNLHQLEDKELAAKMLNSPRLNATQGKCLRMRFLENMKLREIAAVLGITKQGVNFSIKKALKVLRAEFCQESC